MSDIEGASDATDEKEAAEAAEDAASPPAKSRQAVVIVHGMGEQRPMDTLRGFVKAVWSGDLALTAGPRRNTTTDPDLPTSTINKSWIRPDADTKSYELRRITTPYDVNGRRTDFYELYWADITQGTPAKRLTGWARVLLLRRPRDVPRDARKLYVAAWLVVLAFVGGYGSYFYVLRRSGPVAVSAWLYLTPAVAALWAWPMFGEPLTVRAAVGFLVAAAGVAAVVRPQGSDPRDPGPTTPARARVVRLATRA